jgi:methylmalonyl-CoA mutase, N-terminal domain
VTSTIDPLGGSYYVEALTDQLERRAYEYFNGIDELGGMVVAVKKNFCQQEIADASFDLQRRIDSNRRVVVGVNRYTIENEKEMPILRIDPTIESKQLGRLAAVRTRRDGRGVEAALGDLRAAAATKTNLIQPLLDAARVHAGEGEIVTALQDVWGGYTHTPVF